MSEIGETNFSRIKCAEIFFENSDEFSINCVFCDIKSLEISNFVSHFNNLHLVSIKKSNKTVENIPFDVIKSEAQQNYDEDVNNVSSNITITDQDFSKTEKEKFDFIKKEQFLNIHISLPEENSNESTCALSCDTCGKKFQNTKALRCHRTITHLNGKPKKKNQEENIKNLDESNPSKHRKNIIKTDFVCLQCGKNLSTPRALQLHERRHTGYRAHKCDYTDCNKSFYTAYELRMHKHVHSDIRDAICEICGRSARNISDLNLHKRIHTGEKPHVCETCGKRFTTRSDLKEHMSMHSSERPYVCIACGATFSRIKALNQHKNLHLKIKKFVCRLCGSAFAQAAGLSGHMKKHEIIETN